RGEPGARGQVLRARVPDRRGPLLRAARSLRARCDAGAERRDRRLACEVERARLCGRGASAINTSVARRRRGERAWRVVGATCALLCASQPAATLAQAEPAAASAPAR